MDSLTENKSPGTITSKIEISKDSTEEISRNGLMDTFAVKTDKNPFKYDETAESLNEYLALLTSMEGQIQGALHEKLDSLKPIDYALFDSLLVQELKQHDISIPYKLEVVQVKDSLPETVITFRSADTLSTKG